MLYGNGDYGATIDISTRCGYDSDCNPANAAGILGTMIGYSKIPDYWKQGIDKVEDMNFSYTEMSLHKVYETGFHHAVEMIKRNGGKEEGNKIIVQYQKPQAVPLEIAFEGVFPTERKMLTGQLSSKEPELSFEMVGCGFVITGQAAKEDQLPDTTLEVDVFADGQLLETVKIPTQYRTRRLDVAWNYDLKEEPHTITLKAKYIPEGYRIEFSPTGNRKNGVLIYSSVKPESHTHF